MARQGRNLRSRVVGTWLRTPRPIGRGRALRRPGVDQQHRRLQAGQLRRLRDGRQRPRVGQFRLPRVPGDRRGPRLRAAASTRVHPSGCGGAVADTDVRRARRCVGRSGGVEGYGRPRFTPQCGAREASAVSCAPHSLLFELGSNPSYPARPDADPRQLMATITLLELTEGAAASQSFSSGEPTSSPQLFAGVGCLLQSQNGDFTWAC